MLVSSKLFTLDSFRQRASEFMLVISTLFHINTVAIPSAQAAPCALSKDKQAAHHGE
jgi:hypothetical protein